MAYETKYRIQFTNEQYQQIDIYLMKKDASPGGVQFYAATSVLMNVTSPSNRIDDWIFTRELEISFDMRPEDVDYWPDFVDAEQDTWRVQVLIDNNHRLFDGYVLPDEGLSPLYDRPYDATI